VTVLLSIEKEGAVSISALDRVYNSKTLKILNFVVVRNNNNNFVS
jgi:hypothetical protein